MSSTGSPARLSELIAALSLATDLGLGEPMEHVLRSCLISMRLGERMGLTDAERAEVYYVSLLAWVGYMSDSTEMSALFGDDIAWRADAARVDDGCPTTPNGCLHECPPWPASPRSPSLTMSDSTGPATNVACPAERLDPARDCSLRPTRTRR
jgi:hypothetical protein